MRLNGTGSEHGFTTIEENKEQENEHTFLIACFVLVETSQNHATSRVDVSLDVLLPTVVTQTNS